jgi:hypothetical protein
MLTIAGPRHSHRDFCDGVSRRDILRIGTLAAMGTTMGWTLPDILRAESLTGQKVAEVGHHDLPGRRAAASGHVRPQARGPAGNCRSLATDRHQGAGMEICEAFPKLAGMADKLTVIRSLVGNQADHDAIQVFNGHHPKKPKPSGGWPQFGTMVSKVQGPADAAPRRRTSVCAITCTHGPYNEPGPGFLGAAHSPFRPMGTREDMVLNGVTLERLADRKALLKSFDRLPPRCRSDVDDVGARRLHRTGDGFAHLVGWRKPSISLKEDPRTSPVTARAIRRS